MIVRCRADDSHDDAAPFPHGDVRLLPANILSGTRAQGLPNIRIRYTYKLEPDHTTGKWVIERATGMAALVAHLSPDRWCHIVERWRCEAMTDRRASAILLTPSNIVRRIA